MTEGPPGRRLALLLEYDGSRYGGSQLQPDVPTIQGELERALERLTQKRPRVAFAGRTDAGVHATGQVAAFTTASALETAVFERGLNALLPREIAVRRAIEAPERFDPRRHASSRTYRYTIYNAPVRSPLWRSYAWHVIETLDLAVMRDAASELLGERDFAAFSRREGVSTVRCMRRAHVERRRPLVTFELEANAFLRQQMRRTVGALVQVGSGRLTIGAFRDLLQRAEPNNAEPLAPAHGLCLVHVAYPDLDLERPDALS